MWPARLLHPRCRASTARDDEPDGHVRHGGPARARELREDGPGGCAVRVGANRPGEPALGEAVARLYAAKEEWPKVEAELAEALEIDPGNESVKELWQNARAKTKGK